MTAGPRDETERIRQIYERMARGYDRQLDFVEAFLFADARRWACALARGCVLEIGIGTGRNIPLYRADVELTGVDLSPAMLEVARQRARDLARTVELHVADADTLPFMDGSYDVVVSTLVLCTIPSPEHALAEVHRVLRPGGRLLVVDHVRSPVLAVRLLQLVFDPVLVRFAGDHLLREPADIVTRVGFQIEHLRRTRLGVVERLSARR